MEKEISLKKATIYNLIAKFGTVIIQLGISMALARLVATQEHGVVSLITVILTFLALFADMGLGISIIQHPNMDKHSIEKLFSFSIVLGLILMGAMCLLSFPVSIIYKNEVYLVLCPIASITAFFGTINVVPNAILIRDKRFDLIALRTVLSSLIPGALAVFLAFKGFGVYSLLMQSISSSVFLFLWNYLKNPLRTSRFRLKNILSLLGKYSLFQFLFSILNYFTRNADNLLIGACFGENELGFYNKAYTLNLYPNTILASVITSALHPYIREFKNDFDCLYVKIVKIMKVLSWLGLIISIICFCCSREIILILFGNNWLITAEYFKWLSLCIWAQMVLSVAGSVFLGIEKTNKTFICGAINFFLLLIAITIGVLFKSVLFISIGVSVVYNVAFFITYFILVKQTMNHSFIHFLKEFAFEFVFLFAFSFSSLFFPVISNNIWISLIAKVGICFLSFIAFMLFTGQLFKIKTTIKEAFRS